MKKYFYFVGSRFSGKNMFFRIIENDKKVQKYTSQGKWHKVQKRVNKLFNRYIKEQKK